MKDKNGVEIKIGSIVRWTKNTTDIKAHDDFEAEVKWDYSKDLYTDSPLEGAHRRINKENASELEVVR